MATGAEPDQEQEAVRHKTLAETKFKNSNLKSALKHAKKAHSIFPNLEGLSSMLTAFEILRVAAKAASGTAPDWYKILQVEPFSHINAIKKQYRKLALVLHPDKNPYLGCEEAFKLVGEGFRVFSDRIRRKEYDMNLRMRIQEERVTGLAADAAATNMEETFWTACSRCRLLHQFERKYLEHNLVCPSCKKSFKAVEVKSGADDGETERSRAKVRSERLKRKMGGVHLEAKMGVGERTRSMMSRRKLAREVLGGKKIDSGDEEGSEDLGKEACSTLGGQWGGGRLRSRGLRRRMSTVGEVLARSKEKRVEVGQGSERSKKRVKAREEMMTLAEMQMELKRKLNQEKTTLKSNGEGEEEKGGQETSKNRDSVIENQGSLKKSTNLEIEKQQSSKKNRDSRIQTRGPSKKIVDLETVTRRASKRSGNSEMMKEGALRRKMGSEIVRSRSSKGEDLEIMAVVDSDFYDFDKDRVERSFKKGQVWAIYDDDDGMPRHYGLIDELVSLNPFEVKISWLDLQNNGDETLICWEKTGFHVSCGRFKVSKKTSVDSLNIFSHVMECERAAREVYRIYPKKGSVWALYNEAAVGAEGRSMSARDKRSYDIVVFLTTYSEMHGLSMAYLEKVDGFRTIFKRREIGCHAIRWFEKDDVRLFSHQIPARKLSGDEVPELLRDCWELDPASLPSDLLTTSWRK